MGAVAPTPTELDQIRKLKDHHHLLLLISDLQRAQSWCAARETLKRLNSAR
jgi:hypothetical protein